MDFIEQRDKLKIINVDVQMENTNRYYQVLYLSPIIISISSSEK